MKDAVVKWTGGMAFLAETGTGHTLQMDARPDVGGENQGPRPTELLLAALGGCTGMDVVSILRKMRAPVERFEMTIEADEAEEHPKAFQSFRMVYRFWGPDVAADKVKRAIELSQSTYCSVSALFKKGATVSYIIEINDQPIP